jgi:hypothetical protein
VVENTGLCERLIGGFPRPSSIDFSLENKVVPVIRSTLLREGEESKDGDEELSCVINFVCSGERERRFLVIGAEGESSDRRGDSDSKKRLLKAVTVGGPDGMTGEDERNALFSATNEVSTSMASSMGDDGSVIGCVSAGFDNCIHSVGNADL